MNKKINNLMEVMHSVGFEIDEVKEDNNFIFLHFYNNNYDLITICYCKFSKRYILSGPNKQYITKQYKRLVNYIQKNI
jgi:hypothetical protein